MGRQGSYTPLLSRFDSCGDYHPSASPGVSRNAADAADDPQTDGGLLPEPPMSAVPRPHAVGSMRSCTSLGMLVGPFTPRQKECVQSFRIGSIRTGSQAFVSEGRVAARNSDAVRAGGVASLFYPPFHPRPGAGKGGDALGSGMACYASGEATRLSIE